METNETEIEKLRRELSEVRKMLADAIKERDSAISNAGYAYEHAREMQDIYERSR